VTGTSTRGPKIRAVGAATATSAQVESFIGNLLDVPDPVR